MAQQTGQEREAARLLREVNKRCRALEGTMEGLRRGNQDARRMVDAVLRILNERSLSRRQETRLNELQAELEAHKQKLEELVKEEASVERVLGTISNGEAAPPEEKPKE